MWRSMNYMLAWTIPASGVVALSSTGIFAWSSLLFAFGVLPILDQIIPSNSRNLDPTALKEVESDGVYDFIVWAVFPMQLGLLVWFLLTISNPELSATTFYGRIASMGVLCGVTGINVAHELGHRASKKSQFVAKILLATSMYTHFYVEHNFGHHRNVATPLDAASATRGQWLFPFVVKSFIFGWISAWNIEAKRLKRKGYNTIGVHNEVLVWQLVQWTALALCFYFLGITIGCAWLAAASIGAFLLEATNYIEHYGLVRKKVSDHRFEKVEVHHSWNSNHIMGRIILFELTRHSDHHFAPNKSYPTLNSPEGSPQLPLGYPGMILLSIVCPIFIKVMDNKLDSSRYIAVKMR
ncbi:MAG TPA: alkane 1-monooxygenase [Flavobacteriales bacterium]|nr:alkane 1-monooxygenase [Flavobacteriales bacterium]